MPDGTTALLEAALSEADRCLPNPVSLSGFARHYNAEVERRLNSGVFCPLRLSSSCPFPANTQANMKKSLHVTRGPYPFNPCNLLDSTDFWTYPFLQRSSRR